MEFVQCCWIIFVLFWVVSAFSVKPVKERQSRSSRLGLVTIVVVAAFLLGRFGFTHHGGNWLRGHFLPDTSAVHIAGNLVVFLGLAFTLWARIILGGNWSSSVTFKENHELIQRGPYRIVRHPIYTGLLVMMAGTAVVSGWRVFLLVLAVWFAAFWIKLTQEEAMMTKHFPDAYPAYKQRTKALIPFLF